MRKIHKLDGSFGGTVPVAIDFEPDSFNFFVTGPSISGPYTAVILDNLYSSLFQYGPDLNPWPDLAENVLTETHSDNPTVPEGHTRFIIDIIHNATWSDGVPLTAEDVAFTFSYQYESADFGNPAGTDMQDLFAVYAQSSYRVILEYSTESYWHFSNFAFDYIIPQHIFNDETGIGYEGWNTWNPVFNPTDPFVTSGPFILSDFESGEFVEISWNPLFHYGIASRINPPILPSIDGSEDITYYLGSTGNELVWTTYGDNPSNYSIYMDLTLRESGIWTGGTVRHNIDGLDIGTYLFSLIVQDAEGNSDTNSVHVTVRAQNSTGSDSLSALRIAAISISSGSAIVIIGVIVLIYRNKKGG